MLRLKVLTHQMHLQPVNRYSFSKKSVHNGLCAVTSQILAALSDWFVHLHCRALRRRVALRKFVDVISGIQLTAAFSAFQHH